MDCTASVKGRTKTIWIFLQEAYYGLEKIIGMRIVIIPLTNKKTRVNSNSSNYQLLLLLKNHRNKL